MKKLEYLIFLLFIFDGFSNSIIQQDVPLCGYKSCPQTVNNKINVHLVPHSHDDVGWLKTVDQYYFGSNSEIQKAGVQYTITSVIKALKKNPNRRFIQVETAFFWKWWNDQTQKMRNTTRYLVDNGQLEIVNGAWSMNDEATTNYQSIIDQYTWGLRIINDTLGYCGRPRVGWQIDPFGHSREHVSILAQLGFDGLIIGRLDYRDKNNRIKNKNLNFLWQTSENLNDSKIFGGIFPDFYMPPPGFCWDIECDDEPIIDNPKSFEYNLNERMKDFEELMMNYSTYFKTKNILIPMGGDFQYQSAESNYINMDRLIKAFRNHSSINLIYSTPSCYIKAVNDDIRKNSVKLETKTDDFFPYASDPHSFWTGYFTSRPNIKRFERLGNNILQATKQIFSFTKLQNSLNHEYVLDNFRETMGILQHHDAITGTEKQAVTNDYLRMLTKSIESVEKTLKIIIGDLLKKNTTLAKIDINWQSCLLANVSICNATSPDKFIVILYNPLSYSVSHYVRLPVNENSYKISGTDGVEIIDVLDRMGNFSYIPDNLPKSKVLVFFAKSIPPLGFKLYLVEKLGKSIRKNLINNNKSLYFGTKTTGFEIDQYTNKLKSIKMNGKQITLSQEFMYYDSANGDNNVTNKNYERRASGAYIFRPIQGTNEAKPITKAQIKIKSQKGKLVDEVIQEINDEVTQTIRVYKGKDNNYIEFDWFIGNLKVNKTSLVGKEVITKFIINDFDNDGIFYTDSNGREQIKRQINKRNDYVYNTTEEPISSNYYPITSKIVVRDEKKQLEVAIINDRAQGGGCLKNNTIELMIHRRILKDDNFGVNEALNETEFNEGVHVRGQHYFILGSTNINPDNKTTAAQERILALRKLLAPWVLIGDANSGNFSLESLKNELYFNFSGLQHNLPENVHILTLEPWKNSTYLLRLEHIFEKNEDKNLSLPVTVNLRNLFTLFNIIEIRETTLGANQWLKDNKNEKLIWEQNLNRQFEKKLPSEDNIMEITLYPMQIRTFIIKIEHV